MNSLNANQTSSLNSNSRRTKACITDTSSSRKLDKLNDFFFQYYLYFCINSIQFNMDIAKINFIMIYLSEVIQNWFEVGSVSDL